MLCISFWHLVHFRYLPKGFVIITIWFLLYENRFYMTLTQPISLIWLVALARIFTFTPGIKECMISSLFTVPQYCTLYWSEGAISLYLVWLFGMQARHDCVYTTCGYTTGHRSRLHPLTFTCTNLYSKQFALYYYFIIQKKNCTS